MKSLLMDILQRLVRILAVHTTFVDLACGFSGTGFKTAPAVGACLAELILDGRATTVDISGYSLERFAEGRLLVGDHPYGKLWR